MTFTEILWMSLMVILVVIAISVLVSIVQDLDTEIIELREITKLQNSCIDSLKTDLEELKTKVIQKPKLSRKKEHKAE